jgi:hypothetical protein
MPDELPRCDFGARGSIRRGLACFIGRDVVDGILVSSSHEHLPVVKQHTTARAGLQQHKCDGARTCQRVGWPPCFRKLTFKDRSNAVLDWLPAAATAAAGL